MSMDIYRPELCEIVKTHTVHLLTRNFKDMDYMGACFSAKCNGSDTDYKLNSPTLPALAAAMVSSTALNFESVKRELINHFNEVAMEGVERSSLILSRILSADPNSMQFQIAKERPADPKTGAGAIAGSLIFQLKLGNDLIPIQTVISALDRYLRAVESVNKSMNQDTGTLVIFGPKREGKDKALGSFGASTNWYELPTELKTLETKADGSQVEKTIKVSELSTEAKMAIPLVHEAVENVTAAKQVDIPTFIEGERAGMTAEKVKLIEGVDKITLSQGYISANTTPLIITSDKVHYAIHANGMSTVAHAWRWFYALLGIMARKLLLAMLQSPDILYQNVDGSTLEQLFNKDGKGTIDFEKIDELTFDRLNAQMHTQWTTLAYGIQWIRQCIDKCTGVFILDAIANNPESLFPIHGAQTIKWYLKGTGVDALNTDLARTERVQVFSSFLNQIMAHIDTIREALVKLKPHVKITTPKGEDLWATLEQSGVADARVLQVAGTTPILWARAVYDHNLWFVNGFERQLWLVTHNTLAFGKDDDINPMTRTITWEGIHPNRVVVRRGTVKVLDGIGDMDMHGISQEGNYLILAGPSRQTYAVKVKRGDESDLYLPPLPHGISSVNVA